MHTHLPFAVLLVFIASLCLALQPAPAIGSSARPVLDELGSIGGSTHALAVSGDTILIDEGTNLVVIDAKPAQQPHVSARLALPGYPVAMSIAGSMAIVKTFVYAHTGGSILLLDIHDLSRIELRASYNTLAMPAAFGNLIYIATCDGLHIIDASDPSRLVERGVLSVPYCSSQIALAGSLVVLAESSKLHFVDVHDPANPVAVAEMETPTILAGPQIYGTLLYLGSDMQLQIIDIADPAAPFIRGQIALPNSPRALSVVGTIAYISAAYSTSVLDGPRMLQLVDVGAPSTPALRGSYWFLDEIADFEIVGDMALAAAKGYGLQVVDISQPDTPSLRGSYAPPGSVYDLQVADGLAYLAVDGYGLDIVDLANPSQPTERGRRRLIGQALDVQVAGGLAVVRDDRSLWLVDARQPDQLTDMLLAELDGSLLGIGSPWIAVRDNLAYVGYLELVSAHLEYFRTVTVRIFEMDGASQPIPIGAISMRVLTCDCVTYAQFALVDDTIVVADGTDELMLLDVSNPAHPTSGGIATVFDRAVGVQAVGERGYVRTGTNRVSVLGDTPLGHLRPLGAYVSSGAISAMRAVGSTVYLNGEAGFEIVDMHDPAAPVLIGSTVAPQTSSSQIDIVSNHAYLSNRGYGFPYMSVDIEMIDISDPAHPSLDGQSYSIGNVAIQFSGTALVSIGRPRFLGMSRYGWVTVDRLPLLPSREGAKLELPAPPADGAVEGGRIYVADADSGMRIYRFYQQAYLPLISRE